MKADTVNMFIIWILSNTITYLYKYKWHEKQTRIILMNIIHLLLTENIKYCLQTHVRIVTLIILLISFEREIMNIWIFILYSKHLKFSKKYYRNTLYNKKLKIIYKINTVIYIFGITTINLKGHFVLSLLEIIIHINIIER